ncbi:MAG: adenosylcobinamide-phosphate synthase CbiB [Phenylobacterium sp.]|uniref:adenosylcobinamide-phosphate synthase CbiB n=1 Tax=Phenylobacterium sp. TaxID=1871053 RepID=UPI003919006D
MPADPWIVLGAAAIEGAVGYPRALHARLPHPVAWIAALIGGLETGLNRPGWSDGARRVAGVATLLAAVAAAGGAGWLLERALCGMPWGAAGIAALGALGLAARSLFDHVAEVAGPLGLGDMPAARAALGRIVGRDVEGLDAAGVSAAALESLAESFCDGVVAPVFWFLAGGLGGLFVYKAVNTADSLIGHREPPYTHFGWAAARADDAMNLVPARIAGGLICLASGRGWRIMRRDAPRHASPNAGWPEAAMAGALRVRLGGPASYDGAVHQRPVLGEGPRPGPLDLTRGLGRYLGACALAGALLAAGGLAWPR